MIKNGMKKAAFAALLSLSVMGLSGIGLAKADGLVCQNNGQDGNLPFVQDIAKALKFDTLAFASCRPSPNHIDMTYITLLRPSQGQEKCEKNCQYDIAFILAGTKTGKVTKQLIQKDAIIEGDAKLSSISIDDTLYQLSPDQRATAVQMNFERTTPDLKEARRDLYLLIERDNEFKAGLGNVASPDDSELTKLVMDRTVTHVKQNEQCYSYQMVLKRKISLGSYSNGFRALEINTDINDKVAKLENENCVEVPITTSTGQTTVPFNGTVYFIPEWISH
ncbi:hypothetical protein [Bartonella sp. HY761]|uniref:hypothetical protein n=1 Tax=Bartonella sp. HY761 TaxID=2979330 RepID=UPI002207CF14|nr:hypothetical protein [Bartonella sp. HY761]UXN05772.1 hypothetical protein N6A79_10790 [Bartonella sp. HY761]